MSNVDKNGRRICVGDEDRTHGRHRIAIEARSGNVRYFLPDGGGCAYMACADWETTHRSGEPIESISPMAKDRNGAVVERGVRVTAGGLPTEYTVMAVADHPKLETTVWALADDYGHRCVFSVSSLTVIPSPPPTTRSTVTLEHPSTLDAVQYLGGLIETASGVRVVGGGDG